MRWRVRLLTNRLLGRGDDHCRWCGSAGNSERCGGCGFVVLASGTIRGREISGEEARARRADVVELIEQKLPHEQGRLRHRRIERSLRNLRS
jgi:hypothetical protein